LWRDDGDVGRNPRSGQDHTARNFAIILVSVVVVGALVAGLGFAIASFDPFAGLKSSGTGPTVKPIPIPAGACPYLRLVNGAANDANHWDVALNAGTVKAWRAFATRTAPTLVALQTSLFFAIPHVPRPVALKLQGALQQVVIGRPPLLKSTSVFDYLDKSNSALLTGYNDLVDASELVGMACGFTLAPSGSL
jgi:hypothetical protein